MSEKNERERRRQESRDSEGPFKMEQGRIRCRYNNFEECIGGECNAFIELPIKEGKSGEMAVIGVCSDKAMTGILLELAQHIAQIRFSMTAKVMPVGQPSKIVLGPVGRG